MAASSKPTQQKEQEQVLAPNDRHHELELKMRCLELAKLIPVGQEQLLEKKASHFFNWLMNGDGE